MEDQLTLDTAYFGRVDKGLGELLEKDFQKTSDGA